MKAWFCVAVAAIAASLADPLVEGASNAGWFGPGKFTDHSTWDVVPTLIVGLVFVLWHVCLLIRRALVGEADARQVGWPALSFVAIAKLLPIVFSLQLVVLYGMESSEQLVVYGHLLGGTIWVGGPIAASLLVHALACLTVAFIASLIVRAFAEGTVRIVRLVEVIARLQSGQSLSSFYGHRISLAPRHVAAVLRVSAGRAPPYPLL